MQTTVTCVTANSNSLNWWPLIVGGLQFLLGLGLTAYTFRKNLSQKVEERKASWYHKIVADKSIELISSYLEKERVALETAALACENARINPLINAVAVDAFYSSAIADFQQRLRPMRTDATNLALIFDRSLFTQVQDIMLRLDDDISQWFYEARNQGVMHVKRHVGDVLSDFHRDLLRALRDYEFSRLPKLK